MLPQPEPDVQLKVNAHFIPKPAGAIVRFTASNGSYIGSIEYDAANPQALIAMANAFQAFAAQQTGGIQIAPANGIAGLRS
jgi:hypothetical protein